MTDRENPFPHDPDRNEIWDMLVRRDIEAFVAGDWSMVENDFDADGFFAVDGRGSGNPDSWRMSLPTLADYGEVWLADSRSVAGAVDDLADVLYAATTLRDIEISGDRAVAHKKFDGVAHRRDGSRLVLRWQTLYQCRKRDGRWRISGFVGFLPNPMGTTEPDGGRPAKRVPAGAGQHATAGPYSPVLHVDPRRLVVISGQGPLGADGTVVGETIEEQATLTLDNCRRQLRTAGCDLDDVFKVNVYLRDLDDWPRFNAVYRETMPDPLPVRTAVGADLLSTMLVEIEMWAATPA